MGISSILFSNVSLSFGETQVFDQFNLDLSESRVGIIGRNGSGKSQLARLLTGLQTPDSGSVTVHGIDVAHDRRSALSTVGMLFQNPDHQIIFPTVEEELGFGLRNMGLAKSEVKARVSQILERFDRHHWMERSVHTLSQGQRHLVCLMSVLLMEPGVIVLDEPFAGIDMATSLRLARYLDGVTQQLVHITHDLEALTKYDRVIWIERGKIRADGAPETVLAAYQDEMTRLGNSDAFSDI